jgi:hypothetical protein
MHDAGIELDLAFFIGEAAVADGIIVGVVFDNGYRGDHGLERIAASA